jgi:colanic acid/amylovoran biosynthesis glycosyltransferase
VDVFLPDKLLVRKVSDSKFTSVISNFNIEYLKNRFPEIDSSKFRIVRCGIRPDEFKFQTASASRKPAQILSIGRMVETKGFQYLIESVKILKDRGRTVNLTIVGGGDNLEHYKQLTEEKGLGDLVKFTGPLPSNEIQKLMADSDLFVLASCVNSVGDRDGIPVVLMEALAMGIPTVSTEVSGIPELIIPFETGLLVPEKDPKALADAISLYLQERDLRERLPKTGRKLVESEFNVVTNVGKLLNLIRNP